MGMGKITILVTGRCPQEVYRLNHTVHLMCFYVVFSFLFRMITRLYVRSVLVGPVGFYKMYIIFGPSLLP